MTSSDFSIVVLHDNVTVSALRDGAEEVWKMHTFTEDYRHFTLWATNENGGETIKITADTIWHAFRELQKQCEDEGVRFLCNGARKDFRPSGMMLGSNFGRTGYLLPERRERFSIKNLFRRSRNKPMPVVGIFESASLEDTGTVAEQEAYARRYFHS